MMKTIKDLTHLFIEKKRLVDIVAPHTKNLENVNTNIKNTLSELSYEEKKFINKKLFENFSEEHKEKVFKQRNEAIKINSANSYAYFSEFDPDFDTYEIVNIEINRNLMRITVSCLKNENNISGLLRFLDTYSTKWFDRNEIENNNILKLNLE